MKIHIEKSSLHRKGLIASKDIKRGEIIFTIKGKKVKFLISDKKRAEKAGLNWIGLGKNIWIDPSNYGLFINHSCNPNSGIKGTVRVVALRNIKKGEEVTFDYSLSEADIFWHILCNCRQKNCRKKIRSIQFLPEKIFVKHKQDIPRYFQTIFKKYHISHFKNEKELEENWVNFIKKDFRV